MRPGPKPLLGTTITRAERQARYRASYSGGTLKVVYRMAADYRSRPQRWRDATAELIELQSEDQAWLDVLQENLTSSATVDSLQLICELDLSELTNVDPPLGFGRD